MATSTRLRTALRQQLQDAYLSEVKRQAVPVTIYLVNGFQMRGVVKGFDPFTIVIESEKKAHLIYKHAVSTISPNGAVSAPLIREDARAGRAVTTGVPIVKTNGTGNDFVLVDERLVSVDDPVAFARRICDRTDGVGADGVLFLQPSERFDARMRIVNADGSEAEMCGNGMRCVARYLDEHDGLETATVETSAGPIGTRILSRQPYRVAVEMAEPRIGEQHEVAGVRATPVDVGNPHVVVRVDDVDAVDLVQLGPRIERDARYPGGTNVHFVARHGGEWRVVHWERGAGATQACGTGAVAVAAVLIAAGRATSPVTLYVPGGVLEVRWKPGERATLIGDAVREFERIV